MEELLTVRVTPGENPINGPLQAVFTTSEGEFDLGMRTISYEHIPTQVYFPKAQSSLVHIDLKGVEGRIGYMAGAGDALPEGLKAIGYEVDELSESDLAMETLSAFRAVVVGIRFFNVNDRAPQVMARLMEYAKGGGNVIVQYNTSRGISTEGLVPYPLTLSRDRVTEEDAEVIITLPDHPSMRTPNLIAVQDFEGWVQERGLSFPNEWSSEYAAPLRMNDKGESPKDGSLLIAKHGEGHFVYTGLSLFREIPAGVPGAFRLLVNLISL